MFSSPVGRRLREDMERPLDRGWGPILSQGLAGSIYDHSESEIGRFGVGISIPCGEVSSPVTSVFVPGLSEL